MTDNTVSFNDEAKAHTKKLKPGAPILGAVLCLSVGLVIGYAISSGSDPTKSAEYKELTSRYSQLLVEKEEITEHRDKLQTDYTAEKTSNEELQKKLTETENQTTEQETATPPTEPKTQATPTTAPQQTATDQAPAEHRSALKEAQNYLSFSAFSKQGLYDQLTSEYGGKYPADAAQYAVDNVSVDWNQQALKAAQDYLSFTTFSNQALHDQLTSEYGSKFTKEEADYAIANLPK